MFFSKSHAYNEAGRLALDLFLLFKRDVYGTKASELKLSFNIFR